MKRLIFILFLLPIGVMAQSIQLASIKTKPLYFQSETKTISISDNGILEVAPLPAQASITITIIDGTATLADVRDTLCAAWGYQGPANDNTAKLAFLKQALINKIISDYANQKALNSGPAFATQVTIN